MTLGIFAQSISDPVFIIIHLIGLILAVVFAVKIGHQMVPKSIVAAFVFWGIIELFYIFGYLGLFTKELTQVLGQVGLLIAFICVMVGASE
ncbi:MAG: hypothetical protein Q7R96_05500 [Nanoarchaeota archaeon]|nr:hypothetical protein [Nanoarchaeota archaeon]